MPRPLHKLLPTGLALVVSLGVALQLVFVAPVAAAEPDPEARWGKTIAAFEEADSKSPPPSGGVLFVGSSSIRLWKLTESFGDLATINRGFGGSEVADSVHFAPRIILKHRPRVVVVYAGDNDVAKGKSPERVAADYRALVEKVHADLPDARMIYIAIKPSLKRWALVEKMRSANRLIQADCEKDERLFFADIDAPMIGPDGKPRKELFIIDGLHLSPAGYQAWTDVVRPLIDQALAATEKNTSPVAPASSSR